MTGTQGHDLLQLALQLAIDKGGDHRLDEGVGRDAGLRRPNGARFGGAERASAIVVE